MKILVIDVTGVDALTLFLIDKGRAVRERTYRGARQNLLLRIDQFLKSNWEKLGGLALIEGAGSFSGARQAVGILNTLALVKGWPVAGFDRRRYANDQTLLAAINDHFQRQPRVKFLKPIYSGQPNISK